MGGRGVGTNPEELLVCAVSSCYTATLFGVLRRAKLSVDWVAVNAKGTVTGISGHVRVAGIVVSPTILGRDRRVSGSTKRRPTSRTIDVSSASRSHPNWATKSVRCRCETFQR